MLNELIKFTLYIRHKIDFSDLIRSYGTICVEDLNVKGMLKNKNLSRQISDVSWCEFSRMLEYKAKWTDRKVIKVDRFFASSQTCHCCGYQNKDVKDLSVRQWTCPNCGASHDRDVNAAINILQKGKSVISLI